MKKVTVFIWTVFIWSAALALGFGLAPAALGSDSPNYVISSDRVTVVEPASPGLIAVRPGDTIVLEVRDDATGRSRLVRALVSETTSTRPSLQAVVATQLGTPVQFVDLDPATRVVTVYDALGWKRIYNVDGNSLLSLATARSGDTVFLSYRYDRFARPEAVIRLGSW